MADASNPDRVAFPGGYDFKDVIVAIKLAAGTHVKDVPFGATERAVVERFLSELAARHSPGVALSDPFRVRQQELFDERRSLLNSHLKFAWFTLAYWVYVLVALRSGLSSAEYDGGLNVVVAPVRGALRELGIRVSAEECLAEIDRFIPTQVTARNVEAAAHLFLSFARFLHNGALRRRQVVTPGLNLPGICLAFAEGDAQAARDVSTYLTTHGVSIGQQPAQAAGTARLLVLLSRQAMDSDLFWRSLSDWKDRDAVPMVLCLAPRTELYRDPPTDWRKDVWAWLAANLAVELGSETDRYVKLLRALDTSDPKQWWWNKADAVELGLALDVLGLGIPRPATRRTETGSSGAEPYPYVVDGSLVATCLVASKRDARYSAMCNDLLQLRQRPGGQPYSLPWFVLIYRAWIAFARELPGFAYSAEDIAHAEQELQAALFALGIGTSAAQVPAFLEAFANLPWATPPSTPLAVDERAVAFMILVYRLSQAALARGQRVRLRHPLCPAFVSYARADEGFARELVAGLEAKGADVWWDLNSLALGAPLDDSLRSAVGDAKFLLVVETAAAAKSEYVQLEIETAVKRGLQVIPIRPDGEGAGDLANVVSELLARLERSPAEQLRWLQLQPTYRGLCEQLAQARGS